MSAYSLLAGRPGDFAAGIIGGAIGGTVGLAVTVTELLGRRALRRDQK
jgi:hypothetical protein